MHLLAVRIRWLLNEDDGGACTRPRPGSGLGIEDVWRLQVQGLVDGSGCWWCGATASPSSLLSDACILALPFWVSPFNRRATALEPSPSLFSTPYLPFAVITSLRLPALPLSNSALILSQPSTPSTPSFPSTSSMNQQDDVDDDDKDEGAGQRATHSPFHRGLPSIISPAMKGQALLCFKGRRRCIFRSFATAWDLETIIVLVLKSRGGREEGCQ